jgi:hypothetical protein
MPIPGMWKPTFFDSQHNHLRFGCAVWMCSKPSAAMTCVFDVLQNLRPISVVQHRAACRAACSAALVFNVNLSFYPLSDLCSQKRMQRNVAFVQRAIFRCNVCCIQCNGRVSDKPRSLPRPPRAQAHNSTHYRPQLSFMYCLCHKQNCLLCALFRQRPFFCREPAKLRSRQGWTFDFDGHSRARIWARIRHGSGWTLTKKPASGLTKKLYVIVLSVLNLVSDFVKCNHPIGRKFCCT